MAGLVTAEKQVIANPSDTYGYAAEQRALAASIRSLVPVASRAEAETVAAAMAADGRPVSNANPLVVFRQDNERVEIKTSSGWGGPPQGIIAYTEMLSQSGIITSQQVVKHLPSVSFKAGRTYRLGVEGNYYVTDTSSTFIYTIFSDTTAAAPTSTANLVQMASQADRPTTAMEGRRINLSFLYRPTVDTTIQLKFTAQRLQGTANLYISGSADNPVMFYVEDMGLMQGLIV